MEFKGSKTEANLMTAFAGESQARNKYTFYAAQAKKDGYEQIADIFTMTAANEKEHAEIWFHLLHGEQTGSTGSNLKDAAAGENFEWTQMYTNFSEEAKAEGFAEISTLFSLVAGIEKEHAERYKALSTNLEKGIVFARSGEVVWLCRNCGHLHVGKEAPKICPVCRHPQAFFEIKANNY